ncbi:dTDP-glucose 4,6-dehydratase [Alicyclobacillus hesperidum subsp. aegles]|uniref:dTDP-glucose 4,6-dehydratase n=1 Tax=Alicyclobacillus hesperidum TaxID=89784 RepID=UPI00222CC431|nr:dTDP-glucose 4,6-dehydratase [Alicyclobacillus hesperidum]GLG02046.1 dTDP-glucose 4,6-dehydratase [Alicyclobacillus hesperidum subsp. aegles]
MRILITGGAGFIGSNFIRYMRSSHPEDQIVNIDALTYAGNLDNLRDVDAKQYAFVKADITNANEIEPLVEQGFDVIVNFAAESHVDRSILDPSAFVRTNVMGTQVLLDAAKKYGVKKFVQVSTDEVYGTLAPDDDAFTETTPIQPNSPYSASKASADLIVRAYHETYGMDVNITRCSNNYGPYQFPEKLIPLMIINALEDKPLPVYGDGQQVRDWLHVWDHCAGIDLVMRQGKGGEVYNIGGNNERTNLDIVRTVLKYLGKPESLIRHIADRPGHDRRYAIDARKIRAELGWKPRYTFESGISETIEWYLNHREWWVAVRDGTYRNYYEKMYGARLGESRF